MTNWHDPAHEVATAITFIKLTHVMAGLYIWEFVVNLDFEYDAIMRNRKFTSSYPLYIGCRWCTLFAVIVHLLLLDTTYEVNCQALVSIIYTFMSLPVLSASVLVILRVYALWQRNKVVIGIASAVWLADAAVNIYVATTSRGHWTDGSCVIDNLLNGRLSLSAIFISDLVLITVMISGVLRWKETHGIAGTWWLLYKQGLAWIVLLTLAEIPAVVFIFLNLNDQMNKMFPIPGVIILTVGVTRMYRGLVNSVGFD